MTGTRTWGGAMWTGGRRRRTTNELTGANEAAALAATLGRELRAARKAAGLTQGEAGHRIGVSHTRYGDLERGHGAGAPMGLWIAAGLAVGRPLAIATARSSVPELRDAGHLGPQETVIRLAAEHGITGLFELQTRPAPNATYIDVGLRDDQRRILEVVEIWNTLGDLGAAARLFKRKLAEAEEIAVVAGGDRGPYRVAGCWLLRATAANQALVRRYPAIL